MPNLILQAAPAPGSSPLTSAPEAPPLIRIPLSVDLALHVCPALTLLIDFFCFENSYSAKEAGRDAVRVASLFGLWYSVWVEYCASYNGHCA